MISTIIFDFYDVIRIDPYKKWLNDHGFSREGKFYDIAARHDRGMISFEDFIQELSRLSGESPDQVDSAFKTANNFDEDVIVLIESLAVNFKIGMISNAGGPGLRRILQEKNIEKLFNEIVISGEVGHVKPEPEIFNTALERLGSLPQESIFIDDNPRNVQASSRVGIKSILFTCAKELIQDLQKLDVLV